MSRITLAAPQLQTGATLAPRHSLEDILEAFHARADRQSKKVELPESTPVLNSWLRFLKRKPK